MARIIWIDFRVWRSLNSQNWMTGQFTGTPFFLMVSNHRLIIVSCRFPIKPILWWICLSSDFMVKDHIVPALWHLHINLTLAWSSSRRFSKYLLVKPCNVWSYGGFLEWWILKSHMGFNTKIVIHELDDFPINALNCRWCYYYIKTFIYGGFPNIYQFVPFISYDFPIDEFYAQQPWSWWHYSSRFFV